MAIPASVTFLVLLMFGFSEAREFVVGGGGWSTQWKVPSSESYPLNAWAEASRFQVGDTLVWNYDAGVDSVLQVTSEDYSSCNMAAPIQAYSDGNTRVTLNRSGPFYFISGAQGHCDKGQKLIVVVMSPRHTTVHVTRSPAPAPEEPEGPAAAPRPSNGASVLEGGLIAAMGMLILGFF
ncbi:hypothetical protein MLD38_007116 [Melastoma candidum]|uniref:Uncharacterized protein n=1 Tax=Melastoma candidum TaxID=119954 RepID=A0ACB9RS02_9MYRT|nr:hypothetical protein MLD38_007116 [Melastoma candidum]